MTDKAFQYCFCYPPALIKLDFDCTAIEIIKWVEFFAVAKVCGDLRLD
jgi:hypothetical protein